MAADAFPIMPFADESLVRACVDGDPAAWRSFVDRYARLVIRVARRTGERHGIPFAEAELDDLCAEVFYALVKDGAAKLRAYDPRYALSTYLGVIARSATVDALRARRRAAALMAPPDETSEAHPVPAARAPGPGPAEAAERREEARAVEAVLASLPPRERLVVRLFYHGGFRYREIAETLDIPLNTVCSTLSRALEKLRARRSPPPPPCGGTG